MSILVAYILLNRRFLDTIYDMKYTKQNLESQVSSRKPIMVRELEEAVRCVAYNHDGTQVSINLSNMPARIPTVHVYGRSERVTGPSVVAAHVYGRSFSSRG